MDLNGLVVSCQFGTVKIEKRGNCYKIHGDFVELSALKIQARELCFQFATLF